eukprot:4029731-Alexandrium_andersonii.AAC.1
MLRCGNSWAELIRLLRLRRARNNETPRSGARWAAFVPRLMEVSRSAAAAGSARADVGHVAQLAA